MCDFSVPQQLVPPSTLQVGGMQLWPPPLTPYILDTVVKWHNHLQAPTSSSRFFNFRDERVFMAVLNLPELGAPWKALQEAQTVSPLLWVSSMWTSTQLIVSNLHLQKKIVFLLPWHWQVLQTPILSSSLLLTGLACRPPLLMLAARVNRHLMGSLSYEVIFSSWLCSLDFPPLSLWR